MNKKKILIFGWIIAFIFFTLILYGACSFIAYNQNPHHWHWVLRMVFAILEFALFIFAFHLYSEEKKEIIDG